MPAVREVVDPNNALPNVELTPVQVQEWEGLTREKMTITFGGVAEVVTPFRPSGIKEGRFIGKFRVPASTE